MRTTQISYGTGLSNHLKFTGNLVSAWGTFLNHLLNLEVPTAIYLSVSKAKSISRYYLNNRLLGVFVPATEQSKDQRQVQGKIALSGIRVAISTGLGEDSEGDLDDIINNLPIDKKNPSLIIIDEYAEVAIEGFAVAATQGRGLGIGVCFSGQDLAGFIKASKEEATQIFW